MLNILWTFYILKWIIANNSALPVYSTHNVEMSTRDVAYKTQNLNKSVQLTFYPLIYISSWDTQLSSVQIII